MSLKSCSSKKSRDVDSLLSPCKDKPVTQLWPGSYPDPKLWRHQCGLGHLLCLWEMERSQGYNFWSPREEEPEEKAQSAWLVGRCVDNDGQLRSTPLFNLSVLYVANRLQPEQYSEGCGFGGPMQKWGFSPTVHLCTSVTDANNQTQSKTTNETEDSGHYSFLSFTSEEMLNRFLEQVLHPAVEPST